MRGSNPLPSVCKTDALPVELIPLFNFDSFCAPCSYLWREFRCGHDSAVQVTFDYTSITLVPSFSGESLCVRCPGRPQVILLKAPRRIRTANLLITSELLYHWAIRAYLTFSFFMYLLYHNFLKKSMKKKIGFFVRSSLTITPVTFTW